MSLGFQQTVFFLLAVFVVVVVLGCVYLVLFARDFVCLVLNSIGQFNCPSDVHMEMVSGGFWFFFF